MKHNSSTNIEHELARAFICSYLNRKAMEQPLPDAEDYNVDPYESWDPYKAVTSTPTAPFDDEVKVGQIRCLSMWPTYTVGLVVHTWGDDAFFFIPISPYDFPATDMEITMYKGGERPKHEMGSTVFQVWNTGTLEKRTLERGWICGQAGESFFKRLWNFYCYHFLGEILELDHAEDEFIDRKGTPVNDASDVRLEYEEEENKRIWGPSFIIDGIWEELDEKKVKND